MRVFFCLVAAAATGASVQAAEREVMINGGPAPLYGSLETPAQPTPGPAVLLLAGSGPTDRDGNSAGAKPNELRQIADAWAAAGITSVRIDKRGVGKSFAAMSAEADLRLYTYVDDAIAWANWLGSQPNVTCVVIAGHSEGAVIALLAADRAKLCGVISLEGPGRRLGENLRDQIDRGLRDPLRSRADTIITELEAGRFVPTIDPALASLFRPSVQPYQMSVLKTDPAAVAKRFHGPLLIVQGTKDAKVTMPDFQRLAAARPDAQTLIVPDMVHSLKAITSGMAKPAGGLAGVPMPESVVATTVAFIKQRRASDIASR